VINYITHRTAMEQNLKQISQNLWNNDRKLN